MFLGIRMFDTFDKDKIDYEKLRQDLIDQYAAEMVSFSSGLGFLDAMDAEDADHDTLIKMAKKVGIQVNKYQKKR